MIEGLACAWPTGSAGSRESPADAGVSRRTDLAGQQVAVRFMIHDPGASFTTAFDEVLRAAGTRIVHSAIQAPQMNPVMERWIGNCRRERLDRTLV